MHFQIPIQISAPEKKIKYGDKILLIGSCFTEHIGNALDELKFSVLQNPNGILFDPISVCRSLVSYIENKRYTEADLFQLNEVWHSWQHHSRFSNTDKQECLQHINESQKKAHLFLKEADWLLVTLGSSFSYRLSTEAAKSQNSEVVDSSYAGNRKGAGFGEVANCHRAPAQWFNKHLLEIEEIHAAWNDCILQLLQFNPKLRIIFTISPVRHIRDGVIENNRSKARLIESVHQIVHKYEQAYYFPTYELVIDVLRDYRFYDADLVHPNYMATEFVLEKFSDNCIAEEARKLMEEIKKVVIARKHKPFHPTTKAHLLFLAEHYEKTQALQNQFPFLDLTDELNYFSQNSKNR